MVMSEGTVFNRMNRLRDLPSLPEVAMLIDRVVGDTSSSAADVAEVVKDDPALTSSLLRIANSALYAGRHAGSCTNATEAVTRIGFREVRLLCLSLSIVNLFPDKGAQNMDYRAFWQHSLFVANTINVVRRHLPRSLQLSDGWGDSSTYFTCGLLHDIGLLVEDQLFAEEFKKIKRLAKDKGFTLRRAENAVLGTDHCGIGAEAARLWQLPIGVAAAIRNHHSPLEEEGQYKTMTKCLHIADFLSHAHDLGDHGSEEPERLSRRTWDDLGLLVGDIEPIVGAAQREAERSKLFAMLATRA